MQDERRAAALFEEDEETDEQIDDADEVEVVVARGAVRDRTEIGDGGIVIAGG